MVGCQLISLSVALLSSYDFDLGCKLVTLAKGRIEDFSQGVICLRNKKRKHMQNFLPTPLREYYTKYIPIVL